MSADAPLNWEQFEQLFPFRIRFDRSLRVIAVGPSMRRLSPALLPGVRLLDLLRIKRPEVEPDFDSLAAHKDQIFILDMPKTATGRPAVLRAQLFLPGEGEACFLGSPWVTDGRELHALGLAFNDFPLHDAVTDYMLLVQTQGAGLEDARRLADQLREKRAEAEKLARAKSDFLANMSHEIRTPLNAVIGLTGLLLDGELPRAQREHAESIRQAGAALLSVINDILDFSKLEAGSMSFEESAFDLCAVLEEALQLVAHTARAKGLSLSLVYPASCGRSVRGDAGRLRQVFVNLLSNAVKFTERGAVTVRAAQGPVREGRAGFTLRFEDTGIGIPAEAASRLFSPFSQADESMSRRFGGTGLGLAISRRLIELMGGRLWFESSPGKGSTFLVELSLPVEETPSPPDRGRVLLGGAPGPGLEALREALKRLGFRPEPLDAAAQPGAAAVWRDDGKAGAAPLPAGASLLTVYASGAAAPDGALLEPVRDEALSAELSGSPAPDAPAKPRMRNMPKGRPMRILVVEDTPINQRVALSMLDRLGHKADAVANGLEALQALESLPYDLILMDCQMPEMDGFEATRRIREREKRSLLRTPIVAMTAQALQGDRELCIAAGMDDYLSKPVNLESLAKTLARRQPPLARGQMAEIVALVEAGDKDLLHEMSASFSRTAAERLAALDKALSEGDLPAAHKAAHALKGAAAAVGAACLSESCEAIEALLKEGRAQDCAPWAHELRRQCGRALEALESFASR